MINSRSEGKYVNAYFPGPLSHSEGFFVICYLAISTCIIVLLKEIRPSAIARRVTFCVVYPVYGFVGRSFAHIFNEVVKLMPSFTDSYSLGSIPFIVRQIGVVTSIYHRPPSNKGCASIFYMFLIFGFNFRCFCVKISGHAGLLFRSGCFESRQA